MIDTDTAIQIACKNASQTFGMGFTADGVVRNGDYFVALSTIGCRYSADEDYLNGYFIPSFRAFTIELVARVCGQTGIPRIIYANQEI